MTMAELEPLRINARNREQAEYLVRSRAEQRGVDITGVEVANAGPDSWLVTLTVTDGTKGAAAALSDDTQVFHLNTHRRETGR
jgi:hypothetical protein